MKDIPEAIFSNFSEKIQPKLRESLYVRLPWDTIPGQRIFVYKYLTDDFLSLVRKQIPARATKQILKDSLRGIAELHDQQIVHLGCLSPFYIFHCQIQKLIDNQISIKPDNIMVNRYYTGQETTIEQVQIVDLENAACLPKGRYQRN